MANNPRIIDQTEPTGAHDKLVTTVLADAGMVNSAADGAGVKEASFLAFADDYNRLWPISTLASLLKSAASIELQAPALTPERLARVRGTLDKQASLLDCHAQVAVVRDSARRMIGG